MSRRVPHDLDAEALVVGSMINTVDARTDACGLLVAEDFYGPRHRDVFVALLGVVIEGAQVEPTDLTARLVAAGVEIERKEVLALAARGSYTWRPSIARVAELAARRRLIGKAGELSERAYDPTSDFDETVAGWEGAPDSIRAPDVAPEEASEIVELEHGERQEWAIPGVMRRRERAIITGEEGAGKSHLGRWVAMNVAAGRAPFGGDEIDPLPTLIVDLENEEGDIGDAARHLATKIPGYRGGCHARSRPQGIDLTQARDVRWLRSLVAGERPALLVVGPLYKMFRGAEHRSKQSEEAAEIVSNVLDDLRVAYDCALWIEAHAPHGEGGNRDGGRPRGSALWTGWPNFGRWLTRNPPGTNDPRLVQLRNWRGDRHRERAWPWGLRETPSVPWVPVWEKPASNNGTRPSSPVRTPYDEKLTE